MRRTGLKIYTLLATLLLGIAGMMLSVFFPSLTSALIWITVGLVGVISARTIFYTVPQHFLAAAAAAGGLAFINALGAFGGFVGPVMVGWLKDYTGGYDAGMFGMTALLVVAMVATLALKRDGPDGVDAGGGTMSENGNTVAVQQEDGWAILRIDRPAKRNALDRATRVGLRDALAALQGRARAIVLTGTGTSFCAGLDLTQRAAELAAGHPDTAGTEAIELNMAIREHPAIVIAAVNGLALGGGVTLVNMSDLAVAAEEAALGAPEIGFARYASMAGPTTQLLLTRKRAAWFLLSNQRIDAATALDWGLVNEVVPGPELMARCAQPGRRDRARPDPVALAEIKAALNHVPGEVTGWRAALEYGQTVNAAIQAKIAERGKLT